MEIIASHVLAWRLLLKSARACPIVACALRVSSSVRMAPKPSQLNELGSVVLHGAGWRADMRLDRTRRVYGPTRQSRSEAEADLDAMRAASSRDDVARVVEGLALSGACSAVPVFAPIRRGGASEPAAVRCPSGGSSTDLAVLINSPVGSTHCRVKDKALTTKTLYALAR